VVIRRILRRDTNALIKPLQFRVQPEFDKECFDNSSEWLTSSGWSTIGPQSRAAFESVLSTASVLPALA